MYTAPHAVPITEGPNGQLSALERRSYCKNKTGKHAFKLVPAVFVLGETRLVGEQPVGGAHC